MIDSYFPWIAAVFSCFSEDLLQMQLIKTLSDFARHPPPPFPQLKAAVTMKWMSVSRCLIACEFLHLPCPLCLHGHPWGVTAVEQWERCGDELHIGRMFRKVGDIFLWMQRKWSEVGLGKEDFTHDWSSTWTPASHKEAHAEGHSGTFLWRRS